MRKIKVAAVTLTLLTVVSVTGQTRENGRGVVVDKMVATVNGALITYSNLVWQLALQPDTPLDRPRREDLQRAFERVIDQRLIFLEAHKLPHITPKSEEVEKEIAELVRRFPSQAEFQRRISQVGLTAEKLREIIEERVEIEKYLDFRFRSLIVITPKEIADYYRDVYLPRMKQQTPGRIVPTQEEARSEIERTLTESKIASDMTRFLDAERDRAEIVILNPL